uniref:Survival Motor Neuron Gemin2-binding domain-containing protein n=1 Tax=Kalanchoe fedtschenkoi TaxID=63787 RepID=A0A7N0VMP4_KALFE
MGKNDGALWDDSALIDAFDEALSSYKIDGSEEERKAVDLELGGAVEKIAEEDTISDVAKITATAGDADVSDSVVEATSMKEENVHVATITATESDADVSNSAVEATSPVKEEKDDADVSNGTAQVAEVAAVEGYPNPESDADYNLLVNQYYELQEKLQTTWQQLQQFGYPSDQNNTADVGLPYMAAKGEALGDSSNADSGQQLLPCSCFSNQHSYPAGVQGAYSTFQQSFAACCCCPCTSKCVAYSSCPASVCKLCPDAVAGFQPEMSLPLVGDNDIIRVAMGAAEKAISSIKIQASGQQEESGKISRDSENKNSGHTGCETDLTTVLNAWFSAGLATGKYLAEQSNARRPRG